MLYDVRDIMINVCRKYSGNAYKVAIISEQMEQSHMGSKKQGYLNLVLKYEYTLSKGKGKEGNEENWKEGCDPGDSGAAWSLPEL